MGLTQSAPKSPILLLIYINNLSQFFPKPLDGGLVVQEMGKADFTMTADDVVIQRAEGT